MSFDPDALQISAVAAFDEQRELEKSTIIDRRYRKRLDAQKRVVPPTG
jgi:hypothetical protein